MVQVAALARGQEALAAVGAVVALETEPLAEAVRVASWGQAEMRKPAEARRQAEKRKQVEVPAPAETRTWAEARAQAAASAFRKAMALGIPSGLREDVRARLVEAYARSGDADAARRAADAYLAEFPRGRHVQSIRGWLRQP